MPSPPTAEVDLSDPHWSDVAWKQQGDSWPPVTVEAGPPPMAPAQQAPPSPSSGKWMDVSGMEEGELAALLVANDATPPAAHLSAVCARIELLSNHKAPTKLSHRRVYIQDWCEAVGGPVTKRTAAPAPLPPAPATPRSASRPATAGASFGSALLSGGGPAPSTPRSGDPASPLSAVEMELAERISGHRDARGRVHIPPEQLPSLTSDVVAILGKLKSPPSLSARRLLVSVDQDLTPTRKPSRPDPNPREAFSP